MLQYMALLNDNIHGTFTFYHNMIDGTWHRHVCQSWKITGSWDSVFFFVLPSPSRPHYQIPYKAALSATLLSVDNQNWESWRLLSKSVLLKLQNSKKKKRILRFNKKFLVLKKIWGVTSRFLNFLLFGATIRTHQEIQGIQYAGFLK